MPHTAQPLVVTGSGMESEISGVLKGTRWIPKMAQVAFNVSV